MKILQANALELQQGGIRCPACAQGAPLLVERARILLCEKCWDCKPLDGFVVRNFTQAVALLHGGDPKAEVRLAFKEVQATLRRLLRP